MLEGDDSEEALYCEHGSFEHLLFLFYVLIVIIVFVVLAISNGFGDG